MSNDTHGAQNPEHPWKELTEYLSSQNLQRKELSCFFSVPMPKALHVLNALGQSNQDEKYKLFFGFDAKYSTLDRLFSYLGDSLELYTQTYFIVSTQEDRGTWLQSVMQGFLFSCKAKPLCTDIQLHYSIYIFLHWCFFFWPTNMHWCWREDLTRTRAAVHWV